VVAANSNSPCGPLTLRLPRSAPEIPPRTVGCEGAHLLGRTIGEAGATCVFQQIVDPASPLISAKIVAQGDLESDGAPIQVQATGSGTLEGEIDRELVVREGDVVRVDDPKWPATSQGMIVGYVESMRIDEAGEPLRKVIVVRPKLLATSSRPVTLVVEADAGEDPPS
jgi:hypothetical protein